MVESVWEVSEAVRHRLEGIVAARQGRFPYQRLKIRRYRWPQATQRNWQRIDVFEENLENLPGPHDMARECPAAVRDSWASPVMGLRANQFGTGYLPQLPRLGPSDLGV